MYQRGFVSAVTRQSQAHCYTIIAAALTTAIADVGDTAVDIPAEPRGWYHARDVAQLAGVSAQTTKQWTRNGYILASRDIVGNQNIYSYQDVAEAMIIHAILDHGVPASQVHRASVNMRKSGEYGRWPFLSAHLSASHTPQSKGDRSSEMLVLHRDDGKYAIGHSSGQQAILDSIFDLKTILQQLERGGWAVRDLPDLTYIEVDPDRLGGLPTIRGRRISAEQIAISFQQGATEEDIQENYEVSPAEVHDAVRWYATVLTYETAA